MKVVTFGPANQPFRCAAKAGLLAVSTNHTAGTLDVHLSSLGGNELVIRLSSRKDAEEFARAVAAAAAGLAERAAE